jgi:NAD-dependent SIR2 family protein deacetylase
MLEAPAPEGPSATREELLALLRGRALSILTGAGISTESGIPDYRGPETRRRARNPIRFADYMKSDALRARYWARSMIGWERFSRAEPNAAHHALARLERAGATVGVITQNVDRLHQRAGSREVLELHGALAEVRCLDCGLLEPRAELQHRLLVLNPGFHGRSAELAPDGDAELEVALDGFAVPRCVRCDGTLKPNVVFFGENVARPIVDAAYARVEASQALLVIGSSLAVFSGYRFVRRAEERGIPVAIVNLGPSRGDPHATVRVEARAGELVPWLVDALIGP